MCFSAEASFISGASLSLIGLLTLSKNKDKKMEMFATIPLLFGIQQLSEGVVWVTQIDPAFTFHNNFARYIFLFFAFIVWPMWMPISLYNLVDNEKKKRCMASLIGIGAVIASGLFWALMTIGATSSISCNHVEYIVNIPEYFAPWSIFWYCIATIVPLFIVKKKLMRELGLLLIISSGVSYFLYHNHFTSVWCFFAALLSALIYKMIK